MKTFGLIGKNIAYSFSRTYFNNKFKNNKFEDAQYLNFDIDNITYVNELFNKQINGFNVTIPYKQTIIPYLNFLDIHAENIGAVNVIKVKNKQFIGYNTDFIGFKNSITPLLKQHHTKALILGSGGASKAIVYALKQLNIKCLIISRTHQTNNYTAITKELLKQYTIIVNCTPVGTFPNIADDPELPYEFITAQHLAYDLIYNPDETQFLKNCKMNGAQIKNGLEMLEIQAEKAWEIWNS